MATKERHLCEHIRAHNKNNIEQCTVTKYVCHTSSNRLDDTWYLDIRYMKIMGTTITHCPFCGINLYETHDDIPNTIPDRVDEPGPFEHWKE